MQTIGLTQNPLVEIISAYAAPMQQIAAVSATPGWYVVGAFQLPASVEAAKLELLGAVSQAGNLMRARLFDTVAVAPVSGSTTTDIDATTDERVVSGAVALTGGRIYQMQVECIGASGFGVVRAASLS